MGFRDEFLLNFQSLEPCLSLITTPAPMFAGLSISTLIMFTDDCRSFQAATGIREKTAHTRHHQKLEKGKKRKLPPGSLRVCGFLSINVVCIFGGLLLIIALGAGLIGRAGLSAHCRT